jgi:hypothetical protein
MSDEVTLGEVFRLIQAQSQDLSEIKFDVKAQNGKVADHETRISVLEDRIGAAKPPSNMARWGAPVGGGGVGSFLTLLYQWFTK